VRNCRRVCRETRQTATGTVALPKTFLTISLLPIFASPRRDKPELWNFLIPVSTNMPALPGFRANAISPDSPTSSSSKPPRAPPMTADEKIRLSRRVAYFEDFRKLLEGKAHGYAHWDMARATCLKLVMPHFAPLPTSEARR